MSSMHCHITIAIVIVIVIVIVIPRTFHIRCYIMILYIMNLLHQYGWQYVPRQPPPPPPTLTEMKQHHYCIHTNETIIIKLTFEL